MIEVKEATLAEVAKVNQLIPEFDEPYTKEYFEKRCEGKEFIALIAYSESQYAGYMVGYDREGDGSFYCRMTGVVPKFRRKGILTALMNYHNLRAKSHGYKKVALKTRNNKRGMLFYLVKNNFNFTKIEPKIDILQSRVWAEKEL